MSPLASRLVQPDLQALPDWRAAEILNAPDPMAAPLVEWTPTQIGVGSILSVLGAEDGSALLSQIEAASVQNAVLKWGLEILRSGNFDLSLEVTRTTIENLTQAGMLTISQRDKILSLSRRERRPSWAEQNGIFIDARAVGVARGGLL